MSTKEKVLEILSQNEKTAVSGEKLAETCGVSRAAIWKAITALRNMGFQIEGTTNGGYILSGNSDIFSTQTFKAAISKYFPNLSDAHVECFDVIDSTNTYAKKILSECGNLRTPNGELTESGKKYHKSIYVAESQTAGHGRLGRNFISPAKTGIYLTVIYAPKGGIQDPAKLTAFSAVAVCRAIKRLYNVEPKIKWINDIFVNGKKICGILTEGSTNFETGLIESAVTGIGINIKDNPEIFPPEIAKVAGAIESDSAAKNSKVSRVELAALVAGETFNVFEENPAKVMEEYKQLSFMIGKTVQVHPIINDENSVYEAKVIDIDNDAALVVELSDGTKKRLTSGEVSLHSDSFTI